VASDDDAGRVTAMLREQVTVPLLGFVEVVQSASGDSTIGVLSEVFDERGGVEVALNVPEIDERAAAVNLVASENVETAITTEIHDPFGDGEGAIEEDGVVEDSGAGGGRVRVSTFGYKSKFVFGVRVSYGFEKYVVDLVFEIVFWFVVEVFECVFVTLSEINVNSGSERRISSKETAPTKGGQFSGRKI
jgi:hypothetical protein